MTQSIEWKEGGWSQETPTAVITITINDRDYLIDLITYNENIEAGKTKFVTYNDSIIMVTEKQYELLKWGLPN